jgi:vacuolar-type H+-ATPase subunit B/Vma2
VNLYDLAEDALIDIQEEAGHLIRDPQQLRALDTEWNINRESEFARMFRNIDMAFVQAQTIKGNSEAVDAVLQAVLAIRNRAHDDAVSVLSDPHYTLNFNRKMEGK